MTVKITWFEIEKVLDDLSIKQWMVAFGRLHLRTHLNNSGRAGYQSIKLEYIDKAHLKVFIEAFYRSEPKTRSKVISGIVNKIGFKKAPYKMDVWTETNKHLQDVVNISKRGKDFHLDHIVPIQYGYRNNISPELIGGKENLQILTRDENFKKGLKITDKAKELLNKWHLY